MTGASSALPRFATRIGARCQTCHVDPTGGRMRNAMGTQFARDQLPMRASRDDDFKFDTNITDNISIGGDFRTQFLYEDFQRRYTSQAMTAAIYGAVKLGKKITLFLKQDLLNPKYGPFNEGLYSGPEVFGMGKILPNDWYVKFGVFYPNYGWRFDDHTSYIRGGNLGFVGGLPFNFGLIFIPNYKDVGFEVGGPVGDLFVTAGAFNGTGNLVPLQFSKDRAYVGRAEYLVKASPVNIRFGGSYYTYRNYQMGGITVGVGHERFVVLGEIDWTRNSMQLAFSGGGPSYQIFGGRKTMAAGAEVSVLITDGVWGIVKYDIFDPNQGVSPDIVSRLTLGFEIFPYPMVEVRPQIRFELEETTDGVNRNPVDNNVALVQLHFWF